MVGPTSPSWIVVLLVACSPSVDAEGSDVASSAADTSAAATATPTTSSTTVDPSTTTDDPETSDATTTVATDVDLDDCDVWAQDCPRGFKCMPWANDGGDEWNALRCTPVDPDPMPVGAACIVQGNPTSGVDNCERGAMCFDVDPETNNGECIAMCGGSEARPTCPGECVSCSISTGGFLNLCLPPCSPFVESCGEGEACYVFDNLLSCEQDVSGPDAGSIGDPCEFVNTCDHGLFCAGADTVPACDGASGCCAPFCDLGAPDTCGALLPGTVCTAWPDDVASEGCGFDLGACALPS